MPAARKSAVSTTSNWFWRDPTLSLGKRRSANRQSAAPQAPTPAVESLPVPTNRQRRSSKNLSVSATNGSVMRPGVRSGKPASTNLQAQGNTGQKSQKLGFLNFPATSNAGTLPTWLLRFYAVHRYSSVFTFLLVATTLVVYGWTVYSQEIWSRGYRKLQNLQRHERQLTTTNAALTNKMAEEAEQPAAGLALPTPSRTIFLPPASNSPNSIPTQTTPSQETQPPISSPLGY
ncbi:hypothetical protein H6G41_05955 [Tolypothrix sp. FACHB-123]|uniref:hypothetical protein n=1 Tax=Tolypothrix sp. FACHB-123 TaxID=2692868 RepID=UPI0016896A79|nr:hypothetical protein [Tolypothrix sp. FACHB-123]MBD2354171.1 hypothetical protein [Tolypothrix sp. FACHB-123]